MNNQHQEVDFSVNNRFDFIIAGSGFAGSILAMCLVRSGYKVCLIEKKKHPRFAIGESSTPIADMILRDLADRYDLPFLKKMSRYGDWQKNYPEIVCGLKRGFSYFAHQKGKPFESDSRHKHELLVAASMNDENSDTNWLRSDVDHFLVKQAVDIGVFYSDETEISELIRNTETDSWSVKLFRNKKEYNIASEWIIDGTGSSHFSEKFFGAKTETDLFHTNSETIYTHLENVPHWLDDLNHKGFNTDDYPYHPDHSALHHIIDEGWIWMLRFKNDLLSCGIVVDRNHVKLAEDETSTQIWSRVVDQYPSLSHLLKNSKMSELPGRLIRTNRLQRMLDQTAGDGWIALHHTAGFVDPMHSTGIAFSLSGIEKIAKLFSDEAAPEDRDDLLDLMQDQTKKEILFIDQLISMTYRSRWDFDLFSASVMIYFVATVQYEQSRLKGFRPDTFLYAGDPQISALVRDIHDEILHLDHNSSKKEIMDYIESIRERIKPLNPAKLLDPEKHNMYEHTAVKL